MTAEKKKDNTVRDFPIKIGLPKGSLQASTFELFRNAGYGISVSERSYYPRIDDPELEPILIRAQEIPRYVEQGVISAGITGWDWICESGVKIRQIADLVYAKSGFRPVRWVLAVPEDSPFRSASDLQGKRIATELVKITRDFFARRKINCEVEFSWGATEAKPPDLAAAIVELTETGSSLKENKLRIIETVLESTTRLIVNPAAWKRPAKRKKLENLALLLQGAIVAQDKVGLKMNIPRSSLQKVLSLLPALHSPTISQQVDLKWVAVEVAIDEKKVRDLIPRLKEAGASGIIEYSLNKMIL